MTEQEFRRKMLGYAESYAKSGAKVMRSSRLVSIMFCCFSMVNSLIASIAMEHDLMAFTLLLPSAVAIIAAIQIRRQGIKIFRRLMETREECLDDMNRLLNI